MDKVFVVKKINGLGNQLLISMCYLRLRRWHWQWKRLRRFN
jgi:hypothetical protein